MNGHNAPLDRVGLMKFLQIIILSCTVLTFSGCDSGTSTSTEGTQPGECSDGADNDADGDYDCSDSDCFGAPVCNQDTDASDPTDTTDPSDPTDSTDPTDSADTSDPTGPSDSSDSSDPTDPGNECTPECDGLECGDDGCGGSCGTCSEGFACDTEGVCFEMASLVVSPQPGLGQASSTAPIGLDFGRVPLFSLVTATFHLKNDSNVTTLIHSASVEEEVNGEFVLLSFPEQLGPQEEGLLIVQFTPAFDESNASGKLLLQTNTGPTQNSVIDIQLIGEGYFIGEPLLEVAYGGMNYPLDGTCSTGTSGLTACVLSAMSFGAVALNASASEVLTLRNNPLADTCMLPAQPDGSPDCTPVCVITFDTQPGGPNVGLGFTSEQEGFSLLGDTELPFHLVPSNPACQNSEQGVVYGEVDFTVNFDAGDIERDASTELVIESNSPNSNIVEIPIVGSVREVPTAVNELRGCVGTIDEDCSVAGDLAPLERVYLTGANSFDPRDPEDPTMVVAYRWEIIDWPAGADQDMFDVATTEAGQNFSMWLPIAGDYRVRLHVTNDLGTESGISETSDIVISAQPVSSLNIQLTWASPSTNMDLHFVYAGQSTGEVYHQSWDCYWSSCQRGCQGFSSPCEETTQWFLDYDSFEGPNPYLGRVDASGLGPESLSVDAPSDGTYHVYVHYYAIGSGEPSVQTLNTLRIYANGVIVAEYSRTLEKNDLWAITKIVWNDGEAVVTPALSDDVNVVGSVESLNYIPPGGEGYDFGDVF